MRVNNDFITDGQWLLGLLSIITPKTMTQCIVYDNTTKESETFFTLIASKKWLKEHKAKGHEVEGYKYRIYSNGDTVFCGKINLTGSNRAFVANTKQKKPNY